MAIKIFMTIETALLVIFILLYMRDHKLLDAMLEMFSDEIDRKYEELISKEEDSRR